MGTKKVRRTLFSRMNPYPQKKIMTFNKHVKDFDFHVNYDQMDHLSDVEVSYIGSLNISTVNVKGVAEPLEKNNGAGVETKGVKAHFALDESGLLACTNIESVFEKTISVEEQEKEEAKDGKKDGDSWAKLGSTISQFFSGSDGEDGDKGEKTEEKKEDEPSAKEDETKTESKEEEEKKEEKKEKTGGEKYDTKKDKKESKDGKDGKDKEKEKKEEEPSAKEDETKTESKEEE